MSLTFQSISAFWSWVCSVCGFFLDADEDDVCAIWSQEIEEKFMLGSLDINGSL
jgi:hypothetical protein